MQIRQINPFVRGFTNLRYQRVVLITYEPDCPPCYKALHPSQEHLQDHEIQLHPCVFTDNFALVLEGPAVADDLIDQCLSSGLIRDVLYEVQATEDGKTIHLGDTPTSDSAQALIKRLTFHTGHYSRSWEINSDHISEDAFRLLQQLAASSTKTGLNFECFLLDDSYTVGCKLFCTPWTDDHLLEVEGITAEQLKQQQLEAGLPESLIGVLFLASLADVRFLVFDSSALVLENLPLARNAYKQ
ncbi:ABC transporter substrate-binding protein [Pseudomonas syringae group sp. J309-1]|uniref:DUF5983 family protein n=1 Tax=Pseudomonas syringae group sp. J309-1 TaxID=3079588 RepID=UPI002908AD0E|nr:ABC transporter substrate-binding protein [Pseudomonas syringae group sp. J309-1]MDU8358467.1 ABC transporter substrate-binding protein [Pseudomonas syringae group sp. J309-1]